MYNSNATDIVFNFICKKIETNEWLPGEKIWTENELNKNLGVSRVAVRQAIDKLCTMLVLKRIQGSGTFVQKREETSLLGMQIFGTSQKGLLDILEFRLNFEYGNVQLFCKNATDAEIDKLEAIVQEMGNNYDNISFFASDFEFHSIIAKGTKNSLIIMINEILMDVLKKHQEKLYESVGPEIGMHYHSLILNFIKERESEIASMLMKKHIQAAIDEITGKQTDDK